MRGCEESEESEVCEVCEVCEACEVCEVSKQCIPAEYEESQECSPVKCLK